MSDSTSQEPTMEEILASIRRIISEDDAPVAETEAEPAAVAEPEPPLVYNEPEPEPAFEAEPEPVAEAPAAEEDDVLDLTEPLADATPQSIGDLDVFDAAPPAPEPEPAPAPAPSQPLYTPPAADPAPVESLVSAPAAAATASAFGQLSQRIGMPAPTTSLDDVVRELLKPLLADWLDRNLAGIVQAKVDEEVERLARRLG
jgi:cell pole-organizing protein PopZ